MSDDFDFEPIKGLPAVPPKDERILWQGSPDWRSYAVQAFHVRKLVIYFTILTSWYVLSSVYDGMAAGDIWVGLTYFLAGSGLCLALVSGLAWGYARSSVFTITSKRLVMRHGVALPMSLNVPFSKIESVELQVDAAGTGTIALTPLAGNRVAWLVLWPNVRPWHLSNPKPALRCVREPERVADILTQAILQAEGEAVALTSSGTTAQSAGRRAVEPELEAKAA